MTFGVMICVWCQRHWLWTMLYGAGSPYRMDLFVVSAWPAGRLRASMYL